jgi:hypothetical protein
MKYLIFQKQPFGQRTELLATSQIDGFIVTLAHSERTEFVASAKELGTKEPQFEENEGEGLSVYDDPEEVENAINRTKALFREKWPFREEPEFVITPIP